uniref:Putative golgi integral membrane protein 4 n=1 Tax=Rhipicephalus pulchellus TaxID=72859 RepID=L7M228_RHIPC
MNTAVIMRNSKVRTFLYVLLGCCMLFTVFLLSSTHTKLKDSQESNDKCQQQRDSLSAQLQVVYEHKSRLEKTLQLETTDRKKAEDAVKTVRDQAERDRSDARDKIKSLDKELTELKASQAEEFKNLKTSFDTLHQEKEKVDNELANHVALLQQERDSKAKLARQLEEVLQARKTEGQLDLMLQRQLETCRTETAHLYAKLQQQSAAQSQHVVASGGQKPVANAPDLSAGNGPAHVAAPAPSLTQGGGEQKANAKPPTQSERMVGGSNLRQQVAPPLLRPQQMSAPQWGSQLHRPHVPRSGPVARFEPHNAISHFDPRNGDHLVRAFLEAGQHHPLQQQQQQDQQHHPEEYQLAAPNLQQRDGNHAALQHVLAAADGWRREH